jgi:hypothetical protein
MRLSVVSTGLVALAAMYLVASEVGATTVRHVNLAEMTERAETIFRGRILDVGEVTVRASGGEFPALSYRIAVTEAYKGLPPSPRPLIIEIRTLGSLKQYHAGRPPIPGFPLFSIDREYLLFVGPKSRLGLTSTLGLGQGAFMVYQDRLKREVALNAINNRGLLRGMADAPAVEGPIPYETLVGLIKAHVAK